MKAFWLVFVSLLLAMPAAMAVTCRTDYTFARDSLQPLQDLQPFVDLLLERGYYTVTVYGFSSSQDSAKESIALQRASFTANQIAMLSSDRIAAVPQLGFARGMATVFGSLDDNQRVIVTSDQLFQDEYLPAFSAGFIDADKCPVVQHCDEVKQFKGQWYCMKQEASQAFWYGPCAHDRCIGDTEFSVLTSRKQTELRNVLGEDVDSLIRSADDLSSKAAVLHQAGSHIKALDLYQQALELYLKAGSDKAMPVKDARNSVFPYAYKSIDSEQSAEDLLSIVRRADRLTPDYIMPLSFDDEFALGTWLDQKTSIGIYLFWTLVVLVAVFIFTHTWRWALHRHERHRKQFIDESAKGIMSDIKEIDDIHTKKKMLAEDNIARMKGML